MWVKNIELWWIMGKEKKCPDEIRCFDWMGLIDIDWFITTDSLISTDIRSFDLLIIFCKKISWGDLVDKGSNFTHSTTSAVSYGWQWVKMCHTFCEQVMITLVTLLGAWVFISFKTFMWMLLEMSAYFNHHLTICYLRVSNFFWRLSTHMLDTKVL